MPPEFVKHLIARVPGLGPALRRAYGAYRRRGAMRRFGPHYGRWIAERMAARGGDYPAPTSNPPQFDIVTLTFDTDPELLRATARCVLEQDYPHWRWVIWDNASTAAGTQQVLAELARHPQVLVQYNDVNLGITRGHAAALALCEREYVAFLDHDDLIDRDALRINACLIDRCRRPDFLYSDEDKCEREGQRDNPFFKPDPSPALLLDTGYTCHFAVARRDRLRECGAFDDPQVEGAQDWDLALRLTERGCRAVHVPEVLYTWRAGPRSTAIAGTAAKPYVIEAQRACLQAALVRRNLAGQFVVQANPLFPELDGHWRIGRTAAAGPAPLIDLVLLAHPFGARQTPGDWAADCTALLAATRYPHCRLRLIGAGDDSALDAACQALRDAGQPVYRETSAGSSPNVARALNAVLKTPPPGEPAATCLAFVPAEAKIDTRDWLWEAVTLLELHADAALVGGRLFGPRGRVLGGPVVFGGNGLVEAAYAGTRGDEPGYYGLNWCRRNVVAVARAPWVLRRAAAADVGGFDPGFPAVYFDVDLAARCHRAGWQVIYSPDIAARGARAAPARDAEAEADEAARLFQAHYDLIRDDPFYSPFLSLEARRAFRLAQPAERAAPINRQRSRLRIDPGQAWRQPPARSDVYEFFRYATRPAGTSACS